MKHFMRIFYAAGALAAVLLAGCAEYITAQYVLPPEELTDIRAVDTLDIATDVKISGGAAAYPDLTYAAGLIQQRLASRLWQEGYFRTSDTVWGSAEGVAKLYQSFERKQFRHGYGRFATDSTFKRARLDLAFDLRVDVVPETKNLLFTLKYVPYHTQYFGHTPVGVPGIPRLTNVNFPMNFFTLQGRGTLNAVLRDKDGREVYRAVFDGLDYTYRMDLENHGSLPTFAEAAVRIAYPAIDRIVNAVSPHKERRELEISKSCDERVRMLLKEGAFTEVIQRVDQLKEKTPGDYINQGLAYEVIGYYDAADQSYGEACRLDSGSRLALAGKERIANLLDAKKRLRELDPKKNHLQFRKSEYNH